MTRPLDVAIVAAVIVGYLVLVGLSRTYALFGIFVLAVLFGLYLFYRHPVADQLGPACQTCGHAFYSHSVTLTGESTACTSRSGTTPQDDTTMRLLRQDCACHEYAPPPGYTYDPDTHTLREDPK